MVFYLKQIFKSIPNNIHEINKLTGIVNGIYLKATEDLDFNRLVCPNCQRIGDYEIKGYYSRFIYINDVLIPIRILRIKCNGCGHTHAVLFMDFIPYFHLTTEESLIIAFNHFKSLYLDSEIVERLKERFKLFLSWTRHLAIKVTDSLSAINSLAIPSVNLSFLQIHRGCIQIFT